MKKRLKRLVFLTFLVGVFFSGIHHARANKLDKISIKLDWKLEVQFLGFLIARERNFYEMEGLDVEIISSRTVNEISEIPNQVASGIFHYAIGSASLLSAQNRGIPVVSLASVYQFAPSVLFALEESGIRSIKDIKGHSIVIKGNAWRGLLGDFLEVVGMKLSDLKEIPGGFDMTPFYERKIDIWTGFIMDEATNARLKGYKIVTFPLYEYGFNSLGANIYTSRKKVIRGHKLTQRFIRSSVKGWAWAVNNPQKAVEVFLKLMPEKRENANFHYASFNATIPLVRPPGIQIGNIDCKKYLKNIKIQIDDPEDFCTQKFIKNLKSAF